MRARSFPVSYREREEYVIDVPSDSDGVVVIMPRGINAKNRMDFQVAFFLRRGLGPAKFVPKSRGMMIIDVDEGFEVSSKEFQDLVAAEWRKGGGRPTEPGEVKGNPP